MRPDLERLERLVETMRTALEFYATGEEDGDWQFGEWITKTRQDDGKIARAALAAERKSKQ